ncbi:hypothetical protein EPUS_01955 [Endocarpon pusillum Z07020]|uniref:Uncharacterized protein n=1 Tax=Endocarpon pusillum (strain Z07020 / HMAS-L-300199) TaxID=1263415 RepID=U1GPM9_ENDPU|nr:uncharacterized protein EPUS_01955 [Endocarpon pusillum Z07020]ERF74268.1 hypothetical protein EPUS_01955 [Endocarpon pusillum Z07020]
MLSQLCSLICKLPRALWLSVWALLCSLPRSTAAPNPSRVLQNITIEVPTGTTNHSDKHLLCLPSQWVDVFAFFLTNYVSHAMTVKSEPGQALLTQIHASLTALFLPTFGLVRGLSAVVQCAVSSHSELESASKAGALCVVVRSGDWQPMHGDRIEGISVKNLPSDVTSSDFDEIGTPLHSPSLADEEQANAEPQTEAQLQSSQASYHSSCGDTNYDTGSVVTETNGSQDLPLAEYNQSPSNLGTFRVWRTFLPGGCTWKPQKGSFDLTGRKVHGTCDLPQGYALTKLPAGIQFCDMHGNKVLQVDKRSWWTRAWACIKMRWQGIRDGLRRSSTRTSQPETQDVQPRLSPSYSLSKGLFAIFQAFWASYTLWQARGNQIDEYGYAAFGLTVVPYLIMSIINLFSTILTPDYSTVYMVRTDIMDEAERRQGHFDGIVGKIPETPVVGNMDGVFEMQDGRTFIFLSKRDTSPTKNQASKIPSRMELVPMDHISRTCSQPPVTVEIPNYSGDLKHRYCHKRDVQTERSAFFVGLAVGLISLAIIGGISRFKKGSKSTYTQRVWIMTWLAFGTIVGPHYVLAKSGFYDEIMRVALWQVKFMCFMYGVPAIGGFVVVGQMISSYGRCVRLY